MKNIIYKYVLTISFIAIDSERVNYMEFLPDGRMISINKLLKDELPKGTLEGRVWAWKTEGDSISTTWPLGTVVNQYKVSGNQLQWDSENGMKCNRVID